MAVRQVMGAGFNRPGIMGARSGGIPGDHAARFGKNALPKLILNEAVNNCAYCGGSFRPYRPPDGQGGAITLKKMEDKFGFSWRQLAPAQFKETNQRLEDEIVRCNILARGNGTYPRLSHNEQQRIPSFDHIRPEDAFDDEAVDHSLSNGLLAHFLCNSARGNTPILAYLNGDNRHYKYTDGGNTVDIDPNAKKQDTRTPEQVNAIRQAFSDYLKRKVIIGFPANGQTYANSWFAQALDNIVYPVWQRGEAPKEAQTYRRMYKDRVKDLIFVLAKADADFWLGKRFEQIVRNDIPRQTPQRRALLEAIGHVRHHPTFGPALAMRADTNNNPFRQAEGAVLAAMPPQADGEDDDD